MKKSVLESKKGLSDVVTTVLIILLALVAVGIIGTVVINSVNKSSAKVDVLSLCQELNELKITACVDASDSVTVSRGGDTLGTRFTNIKVIYKDATETTAKAVDSATAQVPAVYSSFAIPDLDAAFDAKKVAIAAVVAGDVCPASPVFTCT